MKYRLNRFIERVPLGRRSFCVCGILGLDVCRDCEASFPDKIKLTKNAADCLSDLKLIADVDKKTLNEIEKLLIGHFTEILHHQPKMAKHILKN